MGRLWISLLVSFVVVAAGCGDKHDHDHDHDHDGHGHSHKHGDHDHDHDHGKGGHDHDEHKDHDHDKDGHDHGHENDARFGGKMNEIGDHFAWAEALVDDEDGTLTIWMWDAHVENPMRLKAASLTLKTKLGGKDVELKLAARADELTGETVGNTQQFMVEDARLKGIKSLDGVIVKLEAKGSTFNDVKISWAE